MALQILIRKTFFSLILFKIPLMRFCKTEEKFPYITVKIMFITRLLPLNSYIIWVF